jgi:hypothetical protein
MHCLVCGGDDIHGPVCSCPEGAEVAPPFTLATARNWAARETMPRTRDRAERQAQGAILAGEFQDYRATRHGSSVEAWNGRIEAARFAMYLHNRKVKTLEN